jgi:Protein of unknown function (DUF1569)
MARRTLGSLDEARAALTALDLARLKVTGPWSVGQVLIHCAQSIEYSISGFPRNKPWLFRATVGKLALGVFLRRGYLGHDLAAAIPGAPVPELGEAADALKRLLSAITTFQSHPGPFAPHFAYGPVEKSRYDRVQALHIADHLASFD